MELGAFLDPNLGTFRSAAEGGEHRHVGIEPDTVVAPMTRCDHPPVEVEDPLQLGTVECGNRTPVPRMRKRRYDAQALLTFGWGWRRAPSAATSRPSPPICASTPLPPLAPKPLPLVCHLDQPRPRRIAVLAARRSIGNEARAVVDGVNQHRP